MSNEYTPWLKLNMTELEYWKIKYIETRKELKIAVDALEEITPIAMAPFTGPIVYMHADEALQKIRGMDETQKG